MLIFADGQSDWRYKYILTKWRQFCQILHDVY